MASYVWVGGSSTAFGTAGNWLKDDGTNEVPVDGSTVIFDGRAQNNCAGSDQSAIEPALVRITSDFTKQIGTYSAGTITFLQLGPATTIIGEPRPDGTFGSGSQMIAINFTTDVSVTRVLSTATEGQGGFPPVIIKGTSTTRTLQVFSGWVGDGVYLGESTTLATCSVLGPDARVELGVGATLSTVHQTGGSLTFRSAVTTFNQEGGTARSEGSGAITTADIGGQFVSNSTGTITNANIQNGGYLVLDESNASRTVTNTVIYGTGRVRLPIPYSAVTFTNGIDLLRGATTEQIENGRDVTVSLSAP